METLTIAKRRANAAAAVKEYPPHEHFGSPLDTCRVCGETYTYTPKNDMAAYPVPIGILTLNQKTHRGAVHVAPEQIYGGYANRKGEIRLFGENGVYGVDFKYNTVQKRPQLNADAQARYDMAKAGATFEYCHTTFRRLSYDEILEICSSGSFRVTLGAPRRAPN